MYQFEFIVPISHDELTFMFNWLVAIHKGTNIDWQMTCPKLPGIHVITLHDGDIAMHFKLTFNETAQQINN